VLACVLLMVAVCGVVMSLLLPAAQALFNNVLSDEYRARAFGVMSGGMQVACSPHQEADGGGGATGRGPEYSCGST
jgi:MFS family permease